MKTDAIFQKAKEGLIRLKLHWKAILLITESS